MLITYNFEISKKGVRLLETEMYIAQAPFYRVGFVYCSTYGLLGDLGSASTLYIPYLRYLAAATYTVAV